jgi:hypothetical protein
LPLKREQKEEEVTSRKGQCHKRCPFFVPASCGKPVCPPRQRIGCRVEMDEITKNDFNLNISRYISTAVGEEEIDLAATNEIW